MRRRRSRTRGSKAPARNREWVIWNTQDPATHRLNVYNQLGTGNMYASVILSQGDFQTFFDEPTIVRNIIHWSWTFRTLPAAPEINTFQFGIIRTNLVLPSGTVAAAALPYLPHPWFDGTADWIFNSVQQAMSENITVQRGFANEMTANGLVDIKTKRRFERGHNLVLVAGFDSSNGAQICDWVAGGRSLFFNN